MNLVGAYRTYSLWYIEEQDIIESGDSRYFKNAVLVYAPIVEHPVLGHELYVAEDTKDATDFINKHSYDNKNLSADFEAAIIRSTEAEQQRGILNNSKREQRLNREADERRSEREMEIG